MNCADFKFFFRSVEDANIEESTGSELFPALIPQTGSERVTEDLPSLFEFGMTQTIHTDFLRIKWLEDSDFWCTSKLIYFSTPDQHIFHGGCQGAADSIWGGEGWYKSKNFVTFSECAMIHSCSPMNQHQVKE